MGPGDLWYFPPGIPHSIQGLEDGCEFLLVFDDGHFSDLNTLSISDWFAHTPKEVLSANFGVPIHAFDHIPSEQVYIYQDRVPGPIDSQKVQSPYGEVPQTFKHRLLAQPPLKHLEAVCALSIRLIFQFLKISRPHWWKLSQGDAGVALAS